MNASQTALIGAVLSLAAATAQADDNFWVGAKAGTLGLGLEATWRAVPYLDFRAGANGFSLDVDGNEAGIDYDGEIDLRTFYVTANLRVPLSPFRVTGGVFANGNEIALQSVASGTYDIGDMSFAASDVGTLNALADFDGVAPYLGVGLDFRIADTFGLHLDAGVLRQGSASVSLSATGPLAADANFQNELETERRELEAELDDYTLYPVLSLGISVNF